MLVLTPDVRWSGASVVEGARVDLGGAEEGVQTVPPGDWVR